MFTSLIDPNRNLRIGIWVAASAKILSAAALAIPTASVTTSSVKVGLGEPMANASSSAAGKLKRPSLTTAAAQNSSEDSSSQSKTGCLHEGKWYKEGAKRRISSRSRIYFEPGYFECTSGKWIFRKY
jgi:hypothetical protein